MSVYDESGVDDLIDAAPAQAVYGTERVVGIPRIKLDEFTAKLDKYGVSYPIIQAWRMILTAFTKEQARWDKERRRLEELAKMQKVVEPASPQASKELSKRLAAIRADDSLTPEQKKAQAIDAFKDSIDMVLLFDSVMRGLQEGRSEDRKLCAQMLGLFKEEEQKVVVPEISLNIIVREQDAHLLTGTRVKGLIE